ncbi:MAG TPA: c-type cytochrome [Burkholderiales bacterium]|nr:c-type cytochrome [Burkholderiales bacterium]
MKHLVVPIAVAAAIAVENAALAADEQRGRILYESRCVGCHSLDGNRAGPSHRGVFGRVAGTVPGYAYSPALREARLVWDAASLDRWLASPEGLLPGQRMNFSVPEPQERADLIAYLRTAR